MLKPRRSARKRRAVRKCRIDEGALTVSVPRAGEMLGLSRNSAYEAAKKGQLPVIRVGSRILVPKLALQRLLDVPAPGPSDMSK